MRSTSFLDALTMSILNFCVAVIFTGLHVVNALYDWPNPFVTIAAPFAAAAFFVVTALWFLQLTRTVSTHRSAPNRRSTPGAGNSQRGRVIRFLHGFSHRRWTRSMVG